MSLIFIASVLLALSLSAAEEQPLQEHTSRRLLQSNPNLQAAYIALQAWKSRITSDPQGITATWVGPNVCSYRGVFCAPAPADPCLEVVAGIDLNHGLLSGTLPEELGLLTHLALFHINTNFFCGTLPESFAALHLLFELDISNNRFSGGFPLVTLVMPSLAYLDIRYNSFEGLLPPAVFDKKLDALFVNNNQFISQIPWNLGESPVSVANFANNMFTGAIPISIGNMGKTLNEILFLNNKLDGCIPSSVGMLTDLSVFDVSFNLLGGSLPSTMGNMVALEQLNVASNLLTGVVPASICDLPRLENFTYSNNFFTGESLDCLSDNDVGGRIRDDRGNCIPTRPLQRPVQQCQTFLSQEPSCFPLPAKSLFPPEVPCSPPPRPPY